MKKQFRARFRLLTLLQVVLLVASISILAAALFLTDYVAVPVVLAVIILLQAMGLMRFVESRLDTLEEFFAAINFEDFTRRFIEDDIDLELREAFNRVLARFQEARAERDIQAGYIADEVTDQVFVPFFTTKRNGSGVGLSLSRQIMTAHRGEIVLESNGGGTTVSLLF